MIRKVLACFAVLIPLLVHAGVSRMNSVDWVAVSSFQTTQSNFVQLLNELPNGDCKASSGKTRIRFAKEDSNMLSLLLAAKATGKKIGINYRTNTELPNTTGHGLPACEIVNAWFESD